MHGYTLYAQKEYSISRKNDYQPPQCESTCEVRSILFENKQIRFLWNLASGFIFEKRLKNQFKIFLENFIVLEGSLNIRIVSMPTHGNKLTKALRLSALQNVLPRFEPSFQGVTIEKIVNCRWWYILFVKKTSRVYENDKPSLILKNYLRQSQSATHEHGPKIFRAKAKIVPFVA